MSPERPLRFAAIGAGFWARYQLAAWEELGGGAECVAIYNRSRSKAEALAKELGIPAVYDYAEKLLDTETLDFVDIITAVETHAPFVKQAAERGIPVICQKPMATTLEEAETMVETCRRAGVPFFVHENWRWQTPLRAVKQALDSGAIGTPFRGRIQFSCSFPVFDNQPFLKELDRFILTDIGSHILDTARFLFGEAHSLYCETHRIHRDIKGEDVATVMMPMGEAGTTVVCEMSYASRMERERFPQTYVTVEGTRGSVELGPDYIRRVTTENGTVLTRHAPPRYAWADPAYDVVHASGVPCNADFLRSFRSGIPPETDASDNIKTVRLVFGAYESAQTGQVAVPALRAGGSSHA